MKPVGMRTLEVGYIKRSFQTRRKRRSIYQLMYACPMEEIRVAVVDRFMGTY